MNNCFFTPFIYSFYIGENHEFFKITFYQNHGFSKSRFFPKMTSFQKFAVFQKARYFKITVFAEIRVFHNPNIIKRANPSVFY